MFDKATDCFCPLSVRRWDGNSKVAEKSLELLQVVTIVNEVRHIFVIVISTLVIPDISNIGA
jgi:hypothetical protein